MATRGTIEVRGKTKDGDYIVRPLCRATLDVLETRNPVEVRTIKPKKKHHGMRLVRP